MSLRIEALYLSETWKKNETKNKLPFEIDAFCEV
jgi:hypothetical protein